MYDSSKRKKTPLVFRPTESESEALRHIADVYGISLSDVVRELINTPVSLEQMHNLAANKHNSKN